MKGISPVIASVLLIGITVAIGVMMSSWITHWISNETQDISSACATSTNYNIDSASYSIADEAMTIQITNIGSVDVYEFSVQLMNGTDVMVYNSTDTKFKISPNITESNPLKQQRSAIIKLTMDTDYESGLGETSDFMKVLNGVCPAFSAETRTITKE